MTDTHTPRPNYWSLASLVFGVLGFLFALTAPVPLVPFISLFTWPLGFGALVAGWAGERAAKTAENATAAAQAWWGVRLGCLGWIVQLATSTLKVALVASLVIYGLTALVNNLLSPQPTVIP